MFLLSIAINLFIRLALRFLLRIPIKLAVPILLLGPPAIYALPAAWWGLTVYFVSFTIAMLMWTAFLTTRLE
ncbi:hypothetical protein [Mesorhizobium sp. INR15]|uniref:hypothetical protein n=1 Tax=Mesorhizobium sp. INR15 TaxID=2654248 RepID=UPI001896654C|nr:hypothetical protein [Mesorhizobium sp. INR15]QPC91499.1 hypothetical protein GA829_13245 [Mesorhizobium sp. INR15]